MNLVLRIILIAASIMTFIFISVKLKKSEINITDTVFWILLSVFFIVISIFPNIVFKGAELLGFMAPINFIFLIVIVLLLLRIFMLTLRVSQLEYKLTTLVQELAIRKNEEEQE